MAFIDPDDWIEKDMYEQLLTKCKQWEAPLCLCNFYKDTKKKSQPKYFEFEEELLIDNQIVENLINDIIGVPDLLPKYVYIMGCVWRGIYKREFIEQYHLRFVPKLTVMEDLVFIVQALLKSRRVAIDHGVYYHYVQHSSSALHTYNDKMWQDQLMVYQLLEESIREAGLEEQMRNRLDYRYIGMIFGAIKNETFVKKNSDFKETILRMMDIFTDDKLKEVLERVKPIQVEKNSLMDEEKKRKAKKRPKKEKTKEDKGKKGKKKEIKKDNKKSKERSKKPSLYNESNDEYNV